MTPSNKALLSLLLGLSLVGCAGKSAVKPDRPASNTSSTQNPNGNAAAVVVKDPAAQFEAALVALKAKQLKEARAGFEQLAKEHPEFSGPLTNLGIIDTKGNARARAILSFNRAVSANPRNAVAYNWLGILYREAKNYPLAEQSYQQSLALNPDSAPVVLNLAILYDLYLKRPGDALARYREYQRMTNNRELKVTAWIKAIEATQLPITAPVAPSPAAVKS